MNALNRPKKTPRRIETNPKSKKFPVILSGDIAVKDAFF